MAYKLARVLDEIKFTKRENGKVLNVGTVHTFQGKEAKIVYFVLGADSDSSGAARWAVSDPNMMNVAATRAKEEFYIIGNKKLYGSLGSEVANKTISIIDDYIR
ncbi:AAA domain-containing protein [Alkalicoccobacillus gibsonii]|uniref:AAA domain-containing protein n=1 Tax=Alkalicoccobacillus gibsonii TaxID=79881 RepID=UPI003F7BC07B